PAAALEVDDLRRLGKRGRGTRGQRTPDDRNLRPRRIARAHCGKDQTAEKRSPRQSLPAILSLATVEQLPPRRGSDISRHNHLLCIPTSARELTKVNPTRALTQR